MKTFTTSTEWTKSRPKIHYSPKQDFVPENLFESIKSEKPDVDVQPFGNFTEQVYSKYGMPFKLYDYQEAWVNAFADKPAAGMYFTVGLGKTGTATVTALYHQIKHGGHCLILMPPILLRQWDKWLRSIDGIHSVTVYRGTPTQRKGLDLDVQFILMSIDIFKRDFDRLYEFYKDRNATLIVDEAVSVKNPATMNHKCVWAFHNLDRTYIDRNKSVRPTATKSKQKRQLEESSVSRLKALLKGKL